MAMAMIWRNGNNGYIVTYDDQMKMIWRDGRREGETKMRPQISTRGTNSPAAARERWKYFFQQVLFWQLFLAFGEEYIFEQADLGGDERRPLIF